MTEDDAAVAAWASRNKNRICADCRWMERGLFGRICTHEKCVVADKQDLVTGSIAKGYPVYCRSARHILGRCGPGGFYWEAKA